ncbi:unnamed protein product [Discula destructiva]
MVGEMIILDGVLYQMKSDGSVTAVDDVSPQSNAVAPFAMITHFQPTHTTEAVLSDKADLFAILAFLLPEAHNLYLAIRISGAFRNVTVRTVGGQTEPHEGLADVGAHQTSRTFNESIEGTIIGFRSPAYMQGVSVAGDHLHFISADKKRGGHLLGLASDGEVKVEIAPISKFHLELPVHDDEFNEASLEGDNAGIAAVEG